MLKFSDYASFVALMVLIGFWFSDATKPSEMTALYDMAVVTPATISYMDRERGIALVPCVNDTTVRVTKKFVIVRVGTRTTNFPVMEGDGLPRTSKGFAAYICSEPV